MPDLDTIEFDFEDSSPIIKNANVSESINKPITAPENEQQLNLVQRLSKRRSAEARKSYPPVLKSPEPKPSPPKKTKKSKAKQSKGSSGSNTRATSRALRRMDSRLDDIEDGM